MGKKTGFLEFPRQAVPYHDPLLRLGHYREFLVPASDQHLRQQGARCMDCGVPFCQSEPGCPIDNLIPEWNDLVYRGRWRRALERLHRTNNFPEFTGRVCPAPCEGACVLGVTDPPVTIKNIENAIIERGFAEGWVVAAPPAARTGKEVAIVGSGPAGLAAAQQLNRAGHRVTVFEREDRLGGLLMYGIPGMKLDKEVVERRLALLRAEGISLRTGVAVGSRVSVAELRRDHDALLLACGATVPRDLAIPGRDLSGIHFAMDFLTESTRHLLDGDLERHLAENPLSARGRQVVVIGGGDTGTDCIGTALRHGCSSLVNFELLPRPPETRSSDNPWPEWPRTFRVEYGHAEAAARFGSDPRFFAVSSRRFLGDDAGRVRGIEIASVEWPADETGRLATRELPGTERVIAADLVLLALGFLGPERTLPEQLGVRTDSRTNIDAPHRSFATSEPGIFAAGDCRRGQSLVVWAINEGRGAAAAIDAYLMGGTDLPRPSSGSASVAPGERPPGA